MVVAVVSRSTTVSRSSSSSSIDHTANAFNAAEQRRTRKRITPAQLVQLEQLYYQSSHPTRDQRDALAKRIQMETKSVTIWFQNKRQTDRKVALHNATNSRNLAASRGVSSHKPHITLTTPTSPSCPPEPSIPQPEGAKLPSDRAPRRQSITRSNSLKRVPSNPSSNGSSGASTCSTTSTSSAKPSLDRVASRSEIRFADRAPLSNTSSAMCVDKNSDKILVTDVAGNSAPLSSLNSTVAQSNGSASVPPASPPPSTERPPLWSMMLSSPLTPSSPPTAELVAYTRARKTRTLDWACAAARLAKEVAVFNGLAGPRAPTTISSLGPAVSLTHKDADAYEREYEEATAMTEDEAELVTPHGSQDISIPWASDRGDDAMSVTPICPTAEAMHSIGLMHEAEETSVMVVDERGWQEDEMHAALALCGLRG